MRKYFGTDGMRGETNVFPMTPEMALRLGQAVAQVFAEQGPMRPSVVIGKDTRLSGYMIESALQAGFTSAGFYCLLAGPLPTPAVSQLTRSLRANLGVMISASHNGFKDNGIKIFAHDGFKLPDDMEQRIEELMDNPDKIALASASEIGRAVRVEDATGRYIEACKASLPRDFNLDGFKIVVDCAHGAAYRIAPKIFWEMGAEVIRIGADPDGLNINDGFGSTHPETIAKAVKKYGADLGVSLDGDADRVLLADEKGQIMDGDQLMAVIARHMNERGLLKGGGIAVTQMSNMGLVNYLAEQNITCLRTQVGDRYVVEAMRQNGLNFGGENSGHLIFMDHGTTGDGIIGALQFLYIMALRQLRASELGQTFAKFPQSLHNIRIPNTSSAEDVLQCGAVQGAIQETEQSLGKRGRVLIRQSGTEPLIRVMVEAADDVSVKSHSERIVGTIQAHMA